MCELLIRVIDKINTKDPYLDARCTKRGDVICVQENGWNWGTEELINTDWRIVKIPSVSVDQASVFLSPEIEVDIHNPSKVLQPRGFKFDLSSATIPKAAKTFLADDSRKTPAHTLDISLIQLMLLKLTKPKLIDINIMA